MYLSDSLTNMMSGLGTDKDKLAHSHFRYNFLGRFELDALYSGDWCAGKIVDAPVDDMTREWRKWNGGPRHSAAMIGEEHRLNVRQQVNKALKLARLHGGSAILLGDGAEDPSQPLAVERIAKGGVKYLHVLSRYEIWSKELDRDPMSLYFGQPKAYELSSPTQSLTIHPSRVVRFLGQPRLELTLSIDGWGLSILQRVYDAVRNLAAALQNTASLTHEAKLDVIGVPGLNQNSLDPSYREKMIARFGLVSLSKSNLNTIVHDAQESWEQKQVTFAGLVEVINKFLEVAAGAADMPVTRLLGTSPKGLNATGQSDFRAYYDALSGRQITDLGPALNPLDEALIRSALGSRPAGLTYEWNPLWQMTEAEQAAIALQKAQTAQIYGVLGAMPPSALRASIQAMLLADATYPGLQAALDLAAASKEMPGPLMAKADMTGNEINTPPSGAKTAKT
jgi:uncharacterized protein